MQTGYPSRRTPRGGAEARIHRSGRWELLAVVVIAAVAVLLSEVLFAPPRRSISPPSPSRDPSPTTAESARHINPAGGYSFLRPVGWEVSDSGSVSELTSPDHDVIVSFGLAPDGALQDAAADFAASIEGAYDDAQLQGPRREEIAGRPAIVVGGRAVNDAGAPVRFLAITIRIRGENFAIAVFIDEASDPVRVLPSVEDVIASFEVA